MVKESGSVTASAKKLYEIVRELPDEEVSIEATKDAYVKIHCARADFTLAGNAAAEYPTLPTASPGKTMVVQAVVLRQMIERTMYAASSDETRYNLNGVFIERLSESGKLRILVYTGQFDECMNVLSTENWLQTLEWEHTSAFVNTSRVAWNANGKLPGGTAGFWRRVGPLSQMIVLRAGHMATLEQPEATLAMYQEFVEGVI